MTQRTSLTRERSFELLATPRRRHLLELLREDETQHVGRLAVQIAALERDVSVADVGADASQQVHISLVHEHLPRLADHNVVEYDRETGEVVLLDVFSELEPLLDERAGSASATPQVFRTY